MKTKLGIIGAMESEVELLVSLLENKECRKIGKHTYYTGTLSGTPTVIARAGVGKVNAAVCTAAMIIEFAPEYILNTGVAGALGSTIPDHHLMQIKWWFFFYHSATIADMDIYHIKDLEDYGDIVLKNIYPLHKRGKQLLVLLNRFALTNVSTNSGECLPHTCFININSLCLLLSLNLNLCRQFGLVFLEYCILCLQFFRIKTALDCLNDVSNLPFHLVVLGFQELQFSASFVLLLGISP